MDIRNCPKCGKIFTYLNSPICTDCQKAEEEAFEILKKYINKNPNCNLNDLAEATEISPKKIIKYIREGRLEIAKGMSGEIRCESCGKPISKGKYCDSCVIKINQNVAEMFGEEKKVVKMHIQKKL